MWDYFLVRFNIIKSLLLLSFLLLFTYKSAQSQESSGSDQIPEYPVSLARMNDAFCSTFVWTFLQSTKPDSEAVLRLRPVDTSAVCECSYKAMLTDSKLKAQLSADQATLTKRFQEGTLKSYFTMRLVKAVHSCFADDLEKSLDAIKFPDERSGTSVTK